MVLGALGAYVAVWNILTVNDAEPLANPESGLWLPLVASCLLTVLGLEGVGLRSLRESPGGQLDNDRDTSPS